MQVAKWGNSLAIRLPAAIVKLLDLKEGDEVEIGVAGARRLTMEEKAGRDALIARLRSLAKPLPPGWKFDREEANAR